MKEMHAEIINDQVDIEQSVQISQMCIIMSKTERRVMLKKGWNHC